MTTATNPVAVQDSPRKRSEKRRRTQQLQLRLRPEEKELLRRLAKADGFPTVQAYILSRLPEIAAP